MCQDGRVSPTEQRHYGGMSAQARRSARREQLLDAGLELIGTHGMQGLTVRGVIGQAQVSQRYFYESFPSTDALAVAVFERIVQEVTIVGMSAIADTGQGLRARVRGGLDAVARLVTDDPRKGRILLVEAMATPVLAPLRLQANGAIAALLAMQADLELAGRRTDPATIEITARFLVGGFAESMTALIQDASPHDRDAVVDRCTELFLQAYSMVIAG